MHDQDILCSWCETRPATHTLVRPRTEVGGARWGYLMLPRIALPCCWQCGAEQVQRGIHATMIPLEVEA